ncbi:glycosyltransferase family 2 protein [Streptomyces shenzhenensis]|uniref:glycosyltransferase family 2 protein n=1 Tax=Streptomyces shenzhenensis TaxID=943815 RepID=UPI001F2BF22A|nr:glycosyltransferase family 2 protein [Streptomyces shenzhenensis]
MTSVVVVMACHNRRDTTVRCLRSLVGQCPPEVSLRIVLTDDGSTDGTAAAARAIWPGIHVMQGDGALFWAKGMALAASAAVDYDFLLWLNDDVVLDPGALTRLLATHRALVGSGQDPLVAGALRDPLTGAVTYSGVVRQSLLRPTRFTRVAPAHRPLLVDTMNGNLVLVPRSVVERVGQIDGKFEHGMADFDYGLRARALDCAVWVAPGTLGTCAGNSVAGSYMDLTLSVWERLRLMRTPKGLPPRSWLRFTRRHAGPLWPAYWLWPYLRLAVGGMLVQSRRRVPRSARA